MHPRILLGAATLLASAISRAPAQVRGRVKDGVYTSPSGSFKVRVPDLLQPGVEITDDAPEVDVWLVSFSDALCREFVVTERAGQLAGDSLDAWVDHQVVPKLQAIKVEIRDRRLIHTKQGTAVFLRYLHPQAAPCPRPDTVKPDAEVGTYIFYLGKRFYRLLYVLGLDERLPEVASGIRRGPVDSVLSRFVEGFEVLTPSSQSSTPSTPVAQQPDPVLLGRALKAHPEDLALGFLAQSYNLSGAKTAAQGVTVHMMLDGGDQTIDQSNADQFIALFEGRLKTYDAAIRQRGFSTIAGSYHTKVSPQCTRLGFSDGETTIKQQDFQFQLSNDSISHRGVIVESALAVEHAGDPDIHLVGRVTSGRIVLEHKPSKCALTLMRS
ncbi:MAG: hypothetical protein DMG34_20565 [Acidobacteria bacterium]|nr:MAG: hypothetical protein DMG34_20565 [Acidobacteriota bacterium]